MGTQGQRARWARKDSGRGALLEGPLNDADKVIQQHGVAFAEIEQFVLGAVVNRRNHTASVTLHVRNLQILCDNPLLRAH